MKRILFIIPNLDFGGAQTSFLNISNLLSKKHKVVNVVFNLKNSAEYTFNGELISLNVYPSKNLISKLVSFIARIIKVKKIKKKYQFDYAISFLEGADYVNVLSKAKNEHTIISVRGSKAHDQNIKGALGFIRHKLLIPSLYKKADNIVALNYGIKEELSSIYKLSNRVNVIPNSIEVDYIRSLAEGPVSQEFGFLNNYEVIISHGRLAIEKGYECFLTIFSKLLAQKPDLKFVLIGDGDQMDSLIDKCKILDLKYWQSELYQNGKPDTKANVYFLGYQKNPFPYLKVAKLYVFPSLHEGFGNSLLEAMACSLPVVASDCPYGPAEILVKNKEKAKYGILLDIPNNERAVELWSNKISELLNNKVMQEKLSIKSLERAKQFNKSDILEKWENLIKY